MPQSAGRLCVYIVVKVLMSSGFSPCSFTAGDLYHTEVEEEDEGQQEREERRSERDRDRNDCVASCVYRGFIC